MISKNSVTLDVGIMKRLALTIAAAALAFAAASAAECKLAEFPVVFKIDGENCAVMNAGSPAAKISAQSALPDKPLIDSFFKKLFRAKKSGNADSISLLLARPQDAKKAAKFLSMFKLDNPDQLSSDLAARIGKNSIVIPFKPSVKKFRSGMNAFVLKKSPEGLKWDLSAKDPIISMMADSAAFSSPKLADSPANQNFLGGDKNSPLAVVVFADSGPLTAFEEDPNVDKLETSKFYRNAQNIFYSYKLDEYAAFMTAKSAEKFNNQYLQMPENERKSALAEYFKWGKKYVKVLDGGALKVVLFRRVKDGEPPQPDMAYILSGPKGLLIANFGADKSNFDLFLSKYIFSSKPYSEIMLGTF